MIRQKLIALKKEICTSIIIIRDCNKPLSINNRIKQKFSKDVEQLNKTINQLAPTDIY